MSLLRRLRSEREDEPRRTILHSTVNVVMVCLGKISQNIMLSPDEVKVWVALDNPNFKSCLIISCSSDCTAEDLCIQLCAKYEIPPLARSLFALRIKGTDHFLADNSLVLFHKKHYEMRIRYKVPSLQHLLRLGDKTYEYYYHQVRHDLFYNAVPEIKYPDDRHFVLGLAITDMFRAYLEDSIIIDDIDKNYKKFIPKVVLEHHGDCAQKKGKETFLKLCKKKESEKEKLLAQTSEVKCAYLEQFHSMAPNYLAEEYCDVLWQNGAEKVTVNLQVSPFCGQDSGLRMFYKREWTHICSIEDLQSFTRRIVLNGLQISTKKPPYFFEFKSPEQLSSFISVCDGYYRLIVKWTFNLSKDDETPSLKRLNAMKCHGPVGGVFSYHKLESIGKNEHGSFIIRQCQDVYNVYYLDVCGKLSAELFEKDLPSIARNKSSYKMTCRKDEENNVEYLVFNDKEYRSIADLIKDYDDPSRDIYLKYLIPPLEHDKSQLLLCADNLWDELHVDNSQLSGVLRHDTRPRCLSPNDVMFLGDSHKMSSSRITGTSKALWKLDRVRKADVAYKCLTEIKYSEDFNCLAVKWATVQSEAIVQMRGMVLTSPAALVFEYLPYGPLDKYLQSNKENKMAQSTHLRSLNLMKVCSALAGALSTLSDAGVVHGHVRCRRLLLAGFNGDCIVAKLAEPSLRDYGRHDIPWLPLEYYKGLEGDTISKSCATVEGDTWAFATTAWEIFSFGQVPPTPEDIEEIEEMWLQKPEHCSDDTWQLMRACWARDGQDRPRPQSVMRDMYSALYRGFIQIGNSTDYEPNGTSPVKLPDLTAQYLKNKLVRLPDMIADQHLIVGSEPRPVNASDSEVKPITIQTIDICDGRRCVVKPFPDKKLGKGFYGKVYLGTLRYEEQHQTNKMQPIYVAIKELYRDKDTVRATFKNELNIMRAVEHENIVKIIGYWESGDKMGIVMEYKPEGSLIDFLRQTPGQLTVTNFIKYSADIASGMEYLSSLNIVHRDLAARNVLVENRLKVKISDFGLSRQLNKKHDVYEVTSPLPLPINWYAPEAAEKPQFTTESDVWSYGVTLWEIFTRGQNVPKYERNRTAEDWADCFPKPADCPEEVYRGVMLRCWAINPQARPTFAVLAALMRDLYEKHEKLAATTLKHSAPT